MAMAKATNECGKKAAMCRRRRLLAVWALASLAASPLQAASSEELEQLKAQINAEIGEMKKDYEGRIEKLEERIDTLEAGQRAVEECGASSRRNLPVKT